jgi:predicted Zn-dependent protease
MFKRTLIYAVSLALFCGMFAGCQVNPVTGKKEFSLVSQDQEIAMGNAYHPDIVFMYDGEYQDVELKQYLGSIVIRLNEVSHRSEMPVDFTVLNTSMINAFAIPGHVYATRGFLAELENEAQFAAVMGHELAHVSCGHSAKGMTRQMVTGVGLGVLATMMDGDSAASKAVIMGSQFSISLMGFSYSRQHEHQADRVGTYYMALGGWDPQESISMQELLGSFHEGKPSFLDKYLSTHPAMEDRILDIRKVITEKDLMNAGLVQGDGVYQARWKGRLTGLYKSTEAFEEYDKATELYSKEDYPAATKAVDAAIRMDPRRAPFYKLKGDILTAQKQYNQAENAYKLALQRDSRFVPANTGLGEVALQRDKYAQAEAQFAIASHGNPGGMMPLYGLGLSRYFQGKFKECIEPLTAVAQANPKAGSVHYLLGNACYKTGQWQAAHNAYAQAVAAGVEDEQLTVAQARVTELAAKLAPPEPAEKEADK